MEAWRLLSQAEKGLRNLVLKIFLEKFGENWVEAYLNKYENIPAKKERLSEIFNRLKTSLQTDIDQYGMLALNITLLDQTYIHQIFDYFILFSWNDLFAPIFQKEKSYWNDVKKIFEKVRNPLAHHKVELLMESEIKKAEEYCREIISIVEKA